jgi:hypothetical protein
VSSAGLADGEETDAGLAEDEETDDCVGWMLLIECLRGCMSFIARTGLDAAGMGSLEDR